MFLCKLINLNKDDNISSKRKQMTFAKFQNLNTLLYQWFHCDLLLLVSQWAEYFQIQWMHYFFSLGTVSNCVSPNILNFIQWYHQMVAACLTTFRIWLYDTKYTLCNGKYPKPCCCVVRKSAQTTLWVDLSWSIWKVVRAREKPKAWQMCWMYSKVHYVYLLLGTWKMYGLGSHSSTEKEIFIVLIGDVYSLL